MVSGLAKIVSPFDFHGLTMFRFIYLYQIDASESVSVSGVITQGRREAAQWVTSFKVRVSSDLKNWVWVECGRVFNGNSDYSTKIFTLFDRPVKARYIRIYPESW